VIFDLVTLFPEVCQAYGETSILGRAQQAGLIEVRTTNPRDFARDRHRTVDDMPYGGGDGMFMPESVVRVADVTDGTSNTLFFGEMCRFLNEPANSGFYFSNIVGAWGDSSFFSGGVRITGGAFVIPNPNTPADTTGQYLNACFSNTVLPPDWIKNGTPPGGPCYLLGQWGFHGLHPGGVNFAFADGSVHFIKNSVNPITYRALGTRALNEVVSADSY